MSKNERIHKTLVFSFDGTGNEPSDAKQFAEDESVSNVLKLHILMGGGIEADNSSTKTLNGEDQITHYYNGIGTREDGQWVPLVGWLISKAQKFVNMTVSPKWGDAARILREARNDFEKCYEDNDRIVVLVLAEVRHWLGNSSARSLTTRISAPSLSWVYSTPSPP